MADGISSFIDPEIYGGTRNPNVMYFGGQRRRRNPFQIGPNFPMRRPMEDDSEEPTLPISAMAGGGTQPPSVPFMDDANLSPPASAEPSPAIRQPRRFPKNEALEQMEPAPTEDQFHPSKKRILAAIALGIAAGMGRGGPEAAGEATSGIIRAPFNKAMRGYETKRRAAKEAADIEARQFELETTAEREARAQTAEERAGTEEKRKQATPVRSIRKKMPDGTHLVDIYVDAQGKEKEVDRGLEGAQPREDTTTTEWDVYLKAAGGDYNKALEMRNKDIARLATLRTGGVDDRQLRQSKLQATRRKDAALKQAEADFRDPKKRGFYKNAEVLESRKQQIQTAFEDELAAGGHDVTPQAGAGGRAGSQGTAKSATKQQVQDYATQFKMTYAQAKAAFEKDGFTVNE